MLDHVLWDRNTGFLKSEIGPFSDVKKKSHLMGLKSAHSQVYDFQESSEVDRFLNGLGIFKRDRALLKTVFALCYMLVRLLAMPSVFCGC